jgi:hypothetical protein
MLECPKEGNMTKAKETMAEWVEKALCSFKEKAEVLNNFEDLSCNLSDIAEKLEITGDTEKAAKFREASSAIEDAGQAADDALEAIAPLTSNAK